MFHIHQIRVRILLVIAVVGLLVASVAPGAASTTALSVSFYCLSLGHGRLECHASASGGTPGYTYTWQPTPLLGSGEFVIIRCTPYQYKTVQVTVTDSSGTTDTDSAAFYCGDAQ